MVDPSAWDLGAVLTVFAIVVTVIIGLLGVFAGFVIYRAVGLGEAKNCAEVAAEYRARLDPQGWERYRAAVQKLLGRIDLIFGFDGESRFWPPYEVCLSLSVLYTITFFLVGYAVADAGALVSIPIFKIETHWAWRVQAVFSGILIMVIFHASTRFGWFERLGQVIGNKFVRRSRILKFSITIIVFLTAVIVSMGVVVGSALIAALFTSFSGEIFAIGVIASVAASAGFFSGVAFSGNPGTGVSSGVSAVVAIVGAVGLLWFISGDTVLLLIFAVLIAALPLTNAFLD